MQPNCAARHNLIDFHPPWYNPEHSGNPDRLAWIVPARSRMADELYTVRTADVESTVPHK